MTGKEICELCGKANANVAYFRTGAVAVTYRHSACDKGHRELSAHEHRQQWSLDQWLQAGGVSDAGSRAGPARRRRG
jgi:hypothetical protein